jgi:hypothetical protein
MSNNFNELIYDSIHIILKFMKVFNIVRDKTMSKRRKIRILKLSNMFNSVSNILKVYDNIENLDLNTFIINSFKKNMLFTKSEYEKTPENIDNLNKYLLELKNVYDGKSKTINKLVFKKKMTGGADADADAGASDDAGADAGASDGDGADADKILEEKKKLEDAIDKGYEDEDNLYEYYKVHCPKLYKYSNDILTDQLKDWKGGETSILQLLLNVFSDVKNRAVIESFVKVSAGETHKRETATETDSETSSDNNIMVQLVDVVNRFNGLIGSTIAAAKEGVVMFNGTKDIISTIVSVIVAMTGVGAIATASSAGVGAVGLTNIVPIATAVLQMIKPLLDFLVTVSVAKQDKTAFIDLSNNIKIIGFIVSLILLLTSILHKIINISNINEVHKFITNDTKILKILQTWEGNITNNKTIEIDTGDSDIDVYKYVIDSAFKLTIETFGIDAGLLLVGLFIKIDLSSVQSTLTSVAENVQDENGIINKIKKILNRIATIIFKPHKIFDLLKPKELEPCPFKKLVNCNDE